MEGRGFRDQAAKFEALGVRVYGVSFDSPAANAKFRAKQGFKYPLWSDQKKALALHYGAVRAAVQPFASRVTLVLDPQGAVFEAFPNEQHKPSAAEHPEAALVALGRR
jgi:thioredoxin-dependent peroxiredoxin